MTATTVGRMARGPASRSEDRRPAHWMYEGSSASQVSSCCRASSGSSNISPHFSQRYHVMSSRSVWTTMLVRGDPTGKGVAPAGSRNGADGGDFR